jgi:hypothetical protein
MNTFYGVWTPTSGALPDVKDLDFAAYYITESGSVPGNSTSFVKDNWLIYICEARGTLSERSYWRVTNGIVLFNPDSHKNVPDPGYYTKVRLDNAGNIVAATDIEYDDLPQEVFDKFEQITDENLNKLIANQLSSIFKNNTLNPIQLKYDAKTGKIGAELKVDEETIGVNELGQLCVIGGVEGGEGSSVSVEFDTTELTELKQKVSALEKEVARITPIKGNGINLSFKKGGVVYSIDIDENSLGFDANGKLCVNPDILSEYLNEGSGGQCANHEHTANQIEGLEDFIKEIINNSSIYNTLIKNISNLVDEETIIINEDGRLEAIATHVQKHQHKMEDITDLNPDIADTWATNQRLHKGNDNQDFNKGAILMSSLTIGEVLIAFNELLKEYKEDIDNFGNRVGTIEPIEPGLIDTATFTDVSKKMDAFDVVLKEDTKVNSGTTMIQTTDVIYLDGSIIHAFIDDVEVGSLKAYDDDDKTFSVGQYGNFNVTYVGDAYPKFKTFQGYYKGFSFTYLIKDLAEGKHTIYFTQENVNSGVITKSDVIEFNTYQDFTPTCEFNILEQPTPNGFVSGVKVFKGEPKLSVQVVAKTFKKRFAPVLTNAFKCLGKDYELELEEVSGGLMVYKPITIDIDDYFGHIAFSAAITDWKEYEIFEGQSGYINIDNSTEEAYRVVQESGPMIPIDNGTDVFSVYDPAVHLVDKYADEAQVKDHKAILAKTNYESLNIGPNYSNKASPQMITLRFECPKMNNFYFDLEDDEGNAFNKNKNGTLKDISIYAGIAPSNVVTRWVDCNNPYEGYGHWETGIIFKALDLFRCDSKRIYATFGKDGDADAGYLYIKLILSGKAVNLEKLVSSIKESLNERR